MLDAGVLGGGQEVGYSLVWVVNSRVRVEMMFVGVKPVEKGDRRA